MFVERNETNERKVPVMLFLRDGNLKRLHVLNLRRL